VEVGMDLQKSKREEATGQSNNSCCILFLGSLAPCILTLAIFFSTKNSTQIQLHVDATSHAQQVHVDAEIMHTETFIDSQTIL
jgi:hypothetical protein